MISQPGNTVDGKPNQCWRLNHRLIVKRVFSTDISLTTKQNVTKLTVVGVTTI